MDKKLYIQIYSLRDELNGATREKRKEIFKKLASYGYAGLQTAGAFENAGEYAEDAHEAGLKIIGTHISLDTLNNETEAVSIHKALGTKLAGIGSMPGIWDKDLTEATFDAGIAKIQSAIEILKRNDLKFTYHHHSVEFAKCGKGRLIEKLMSELDPKYASFVLDTYWIANSGASVLEWMKKFEGRVDILHLKDKAVPLGANDGVITELGNGNLNFKDIIKCAEDIGVTYLCYEQDNGFASTALESAKASAEYFYSII